MIKKRYIDNQTKSSAKKAYGKKIKNKKLRTTNLYPALGAIPRGDHAMDRTEGWMSRVKQVGNKQLENKSALTNMILCKSK